MQRDTRCFQPLPPSLLVQGDRGSTADAHQVDGHRKTERATTASRWSATMHEMTRTSATTSTRPERPWKYRFRASSPRPRQGRAGGSERYGVYGMQELLHGQRTRHTTPNDEKGKGKRRRKRRRTANKRRRIENKADTEVPVSSQRRWGEHEARTSNSMQVFEIPLP